MASDTMARLLVASAITLLACRPVDKASRSGAAVPSASPLAEARVSDKQITRTFPAASVSRVVFRAAQARAARVSVAEGNDISVTGIPRGGAPGYRPPDRKWREISASEWGLDFRAKAFGKTLVISTVNELHFIHHSYSFDQLAISAPKGVEVVLEARQLNGDGAPDLGESPAATLPIKQ